MREDAIREHLSPPPAHIASNLHLAASAAQSEVSAAQSPAEAEAAHAIKTAADAAKALPVINAAIQQNERECVPRAFFLQFLSESLFPFYFCNQHPLPSFRYAQLAKSVPKQQLAPKELTPEEK